MNDEQNMCLKCQYGRAGKKKKDPETGEKYTKCECRYSTGIGKNTGYRKSCKFFEERKDNV